MTERRGEIYRGTPEHPARTCTLEYQEGAICWGAAYSVRGGPEGEKLAMEYLERRECEYDSKTLVDFYKEGESQEALICNEKTSCSFVLGAVIFCARERNMNICKNYIGDQWRSLGLL